MSHLRKALQLRPSHAAPAAEDGRCRGGQVGAIVCPMESGNEDARSKRGKVHLIYLNFVIKV